VEFLRARLILVFSCMVASLDIGAPEFKSTKSDNYLAHYTAKHMTSTTTAKSTSSSVKDRIFPGQ